MPASLSAPAAPHTPSDSARSGSPGRRPGPPQDTAAPPAPRGTRDAAPHRVPRSPDPVTEVVRWSAFSSALVLVVLLVCGSSLPGALGTSIDLAAATIACRALLRESERARAKFADGASGPRRERRRRPGEGSHRGGRHQRSL